MVNPSASSEYIAPRLTPLMICCRRTSQKSISGQRLRSSTSLGSRAWDFRCHADIRSLRVEAVRRSGLVLVILEYAHHLVEDVAIGVERDRALQRLDLRRLHGIAHVVAIGLGTRRRNP